MHGAHPQAHNLLSRLFSYTPRERRLPIEDFCTETLAWCLLNSCDFRKRFLNLIGKPEWDCDVDVHTQQSYKLNEKDDEDELDGNETASDGGRFDLLILPKDGDAFVKSSQKPNGLFKNLISIALSHDHFFDFSKAMETDLKAFSSSLAEVIPAT